MFMLVKELRYAVRRLRKAPGFTLTVVLTLALGLGVTTSIFSLVEGILLRPLPFRDPGRLVLIGDHLGASQNTPVTAREIATYSKSTQAFSSMGAYIDTGYEISGGATPEAVNAARFTAGVFPTLGVEPALGRVFTQQEEDNHQPMAVISYSLWLNRFHRDPQVIGSSIVLDRKPYTIIGVMPRSFEFPLATGHLNQAQVWVPMSFSADELSDQHAGFWGYRAVARLKDGVTVAQAVKDVDRVAQQVMREFPAGMSALQIRGDAVPLHEYAVADARPLLRTLLIAVAIVMLIACVNVAGLLLVRAIRRRREYAVRLALGAGSAAVVRESVFEGLLLSVAGGTFGLATAAFVIRAVLHLLPDSMPRVDSVGMNSTVASFGFLLALLSGAVCSLAPAFAALHTNLTDSLKTGSQTGIGSTSHTWLRSALVVSEIAVALVLLTVSGAFLRSFQKMRAVDPGFRADHVLVASYQLPLQQYSTHTAAETFYRETVERLSTKPGLVSVGLTSGLPASGGLAESTYTIEGQPTEGWKLKFAAFAIPYGDYFRTMGIPLLEGRTFTPNDRADTPLVVVVNETMAKNCWPGQSALGKRMHVGNPRKEYPWATVVGVVADTKIGARDEPTLEQWYGPVTQPAILYGTQATGVLTESAAGYIAVRSELPPEQMTGMLRAAVAEVDPLLALRQIQPMDDVISNVEAPRRFNTGLITGFAAGALLLAIIGIYAVVAFSVSQRNQEIAVRMALGAQRGNIARLVLHSGAKLALLGCVLGVIGSFAVARVIRSLLFEVSPTDPLIHLAGIAIMMLMALLASLIPASRAAAADPVEALRSM
jgi:predicted permease